MANRKILIIANPAARNFNTKALARISRKLCAKGFDPLIKLTALKGDAQNIAKTCAPQIVVAVGGDGTISEVINGLFLNPRRSNPKFKLAIMPFGTANVLAQDLKVGSVHKAFKAIVKGKELNVPLGVVENAAKHKTAFITMASAGVDSVAVAAVNPALKKMLGTLAYIYAFLRTRAEKTEIVATSGDSEYRGACVILSKSKHYGGKFNIFPKASLEAAEMQMMVIPDVKILTLFKTLCRSLPIYSVSSAVLKTSTPKVHAQADGDLSYTLPVKVYTSDYALKIICGGN
jgi:diacylglycerol kinase family enzyme